MESKKKEKEKKSKYYKRNQKSKSKKHGNQGINKNRARYHKAKRNPNNILQNVHVFMNLKGVKLLEKKSE